MKHPSAYTTIPFEGYHVMIVDSGTKVKDERSGEELEVTDTSIARKGTLIWCTQASFDQLRALNDATKIEDGILAYLDRQR